MIAPIERRLLSPDEVAAKLGYSRSWLTDNLAFLKSQGFPDPILGGGHGSPKRWDNRAIDLWLDTRLPDNLKSAAAPVPQADFSLERHLAQRARGMTL